MRLTNNKIAFLAVAFMLISLACSMFICQKALIHITGKATAIGYLRICINHKPVIDEFPSSPFELSWGENFIYDVNAADIDNETQSMRFYDDTDLFEINDSTGIINFTVPSNITSAYYILITARDNSTCGNADDAKILVLNITSQNVAPSILTYYPAENKNITEEQNQTFNISYSDPNLDNISVYWYLNNSLVLFFNDTSNSSRSNYTFIGNYTNAGSYSIRVFISDGSLNDSYEWELNVTNVNRAPGFNRTINNQTWAEDSTLYGLDLDDYSYDPDIDDTLSYSVNYLTNPHSISASINNKNVVTFSQPPNWYGSENVSFNVTDDKGSSNISNMITLTVYDVQETHVTITQVAAGSGGRTVACEEYWFCTMWSVCYQDGTMRRTCTDVNDCGTEYYKPFESKNCTYIPSCFNGIKDGDETGVDCGGSCGPCPSCFDGTMNNNEKGIDCGGMCPPCPTCFDGAMNGGEIGIDCGGACKLENCCLNGYKDPNLKEEGIDCGGNCKKCEVEIEKPSKPGLRWIILSISAVLIAAVILLLFNLGRIKGYIALKTRKLEEKTPEMEIRKIALPMLNSLEKSIHSNAIEASSKDFFSAIRIILAKIFNLKEEFTYESLIPVIKESSINPPLKPILLQYIHRIIHVAYSGYPISKEELMLLAKEFRIIIYLITKSFGTAKKGKSIEEKGKYESKSEEFYIALSKSLCMLEAHQTEKAGKMLAHAEKIYSLLKESEKKEVENYLRRIGNEAELFRKNSERNEKRKSKIVAVGMVILLLTLSLITLNTFYAGNPTGFFAIVNRNAVQEGAPPNLMGMPVFNIQAGEHFVYRAQAYDSEGVELLFSDDTKLFNISSDGIIDFTPSEGNAGVHHVTLIVKDSRYKTSFQDVIFNITGQEQEELTEEIAEANISQNANETPEIASYANSMVINASGQVQNITPLINITNLNETYANESFNLASGFALDVLSIAVNKFKLGDIAEFNVLIENIGNESVENVYYEVVLNYSNGSNVTGIQSTPLNIAAQEKKEVIAYWNSTIMPPGSYTGKLEVICSSKRKEYGLLMNVSAAEIKTAIKGVTGMVVSSLGVNEAEPSYKLYPLLMSVIITIIIGDLILFRFYSMKNRDKK